MTVRQEDLSYVEACDVADSYVWLICKYNSRRRNGALGYIRFSDETWEPEVCCKFLDTRDTWTPSEIQTRRSVYSQTWTSLLKEDKNQFITFRQLYYLKEINVNRATSKYLRSWNFLAVQIVGGNKYRK